MIYESDYWKKELYTSFLTIAKFRYLKRITEQSNVKVEKSVMIGAYIIRKLNDAHKIPSNFLQKKELLQFFVCKGTIIDHMNCHRIDIHFKFDKIVKAQKDWKFIINQIIHSFCFFFSFDNSNKLDGFLINSDKTKKEALFFLPLNILLTMFLTVSEGGITSASLDRQMIENRNETPKPGECEFENVIYSYPSGFIIEKAISETFKGLIYKRSTNKI